MVLIARHTLLKTKAMTAAADTFGTAVVLAELSAATVSFQRHQASFPLR